MASPDIFTSFFQGLNRGKEEQKQKKLDAEQAEQRKLQQDVLKHQLASLKLKDKFDEFQSRRGGELQAATAKIGQLTPDAFSPQLRDILANQKATVTGTNGISAEVPTPFNPAMVMQKNAPAQISAGPFGEPAYEMPIPNQQEVQMAEADKQKQAVSNAYDMEYGKKKAQLQAEALFGSKTSTDESSQFKEVLVDGKVQNVYVAPKSRKIYGLDGKEIDGSRVGVYIAPTKSEGDLARMMPVMERVAKQLAGIGPNGEKVTPDLTSIRNISSMRGDQRMLLYDMVTQLDPNYDTSKIDRMIAMQNNADNGKMSDQILSFNTFLGHAGQLVDTVENLKLYQSKIFNKSINWLRANVKDSPEYYRVLAALEPVKKEFESFLLNNRALYAEDRKNADAIVSEDTPISSLLASVNQMGHAAQTRATEQNNKYRKLMGRDIENLYSDEGLYGARKIGLKIEQPGTNGEPNAKSSKPKSMKLPNGIVLTLQSDGTYK